VFGFADAIETARVLAMKADAAIISVAVRGDIVLLHLSRSGSNRVLGELVVRW